MLPQPVTPGILGALALGWALMLLPVGGAASGDRVFPVRGGADYAEAHHDYPAVDLFADCGTPAVAPVAGVILEVSRVDRWDPRRNLGERRGGRSYSLLGVDGVRYYGSHLRRVGAGLRPGTPVRAGEVLGWVGRTGSARPTPCHLHFGISPVCDGLGPWWVRRGVVGAYPFLRSWERGGERSPAAAVGRWGRLHGCTGGP